MRNALLLMPPLLLALPAHAWADKPEPPPPVQEPFLDPDVIELERHVFGDREEPPAPLIIVEHPGPPAVQPPAVQPPADRLDIGRPGSHFLLELNAGATFGSEPAEAAAALIGMGGKPVGFPWRFYFVMEAGHTHVRDAGMASSGAFVADQRYWGVAAGLRIYVPVWGPVRLFGDGTLGGAHVNSSLGRTGLGVLEAADWYVMGTVAAGVQVRVLHELSIGLRGKLLLAGDGLSELRDVLEVPGGNPAIVTAGLTWHI